MDSFLSFIIYCKKKWGSFVEFWLIIRHLYATIAKEKELNFRRNMYEMYIQTRDLLFLYFISWPIFLFVRGKYISVCDKSHDILRHPSYYKHVHLRRKFVFFCPFVCAKHLYRMHTIQAKRTGCYITLFLYNGQIFPLVPPPFFSLMLQIKPANKKKGTIFCWR